jgi:catechol 2,3-dioxygenase-like lactoylglutathione lyase family enzyme
MATVSRLEHIGIGTSRARYREMIQFYERVFGWHLIKEAPGQLAFIGDGAGGRIEIVANDAPPLAAPHHLAFVVDLAEFDSTMETLKEAGAVVQEPSTNPFGDRLLFFTDPMGNAAQIVGRIEPLAP